MCERGFLLEKYCSVAMEITCWRQVPELWIAAVSERRAWSPPAAKGLLLFWYQVRHLQAGAGLRCHMRHLHARAKQCAWRRCVVALQSALMYLQRTNSAMNLQCAPHALQFG